ncbi:hypothetical protein AB4519_01655 [Vibrio splendidus]
MHKANVYIREHVIIGDSLNKETVLNHSLTMVQANKLKRELYKDGLDYLYSSIVTFASALSSIEQGFYSWPTVKLYYSAFYALRAQMAFDNICVFYVGNKPYSIKAFQNESPVKEAGNTHKCVIDSHKRYYASSDIHNQQIDLTLPFSWLTLLREQANYKKPKYCEPNPPEHLKAFTSGATTTRDRLCSYVNDIQNLYTYDKDHAVVAMPLKTIDNAISSLKQSGSQFAEEDLCYIESLLTTEQQFSDSFGCLLN